MKSNMYDNVLSKTDTWITNVSNRIGKEFKSAQPFDKQKISNEQLFQAYQQLTPEDMQMLLTKHPRDVINSLIFDMEQYRRQSNGSTT
jgi:hypothetical protein